MRASNARNLCTLSGLFRTSKLKTAKPQSYPLASSIHEDHYDDFSDIGGDSHSTRNALEFERPSDSGKLPDLVSKQISSMLSDQKTLSKGQAQKLAKLKSTLNLSILKDDSSELDGGSKLMRFKDIEYAPLSRSVSDSDEAQKKLSRGQIRHSSKMKFSPQALPISEDDFSELDSEHSLSSREALDFVQPSVSENSPNPSTDPISDILCDGRGDDVEKVDIQLDLPWILGPFGGSISQLQKEKTRDRKQKWIFKKHTLKNRFDRVVKFCADKLGTKATVEVLGKLGRETGMKEYNALIEVCIKNARETNDEEVAVEEMSKAFRLFREMREQGYELREQTYSPLLVYLIDMGMVEEFQLFSEVIKDENPVQFQDWVTTK